MFWLGAAAVSVAAGGLALWWMPHQETVFGLGLGATVGWILHQQFRANR